MAHLCALGAIAEGQSPTSWCPNCHCARTNAKGWPGVPRSDGSSGLHGNRSGIEINPLAIDEQVDRFRWKADSDPVACPNRTAAAFEDFD